MENKRADAFAPALFAIAFVGSPTRADERVLFYG